VFGFYCGCFAVFCAFFSVPTESSARALRGLFGSPSVHPNNRLRTFVTLTVDKLVAAPADPIERAAAAHAHKTKEMVQEKRRRRKKTTLAARAT
jgi:hypothetical protein